jgi:hypothetical protein
VLDGRSCEGIGEDGVDVTHAVDDHSDLALVDLTGGPCLQNSRK